ncbi:hypothetical protein M3Y99_00166600 [Aphelenchoides fujianensis]|nr:hypothetical protein M3Y99_00166600 [Aphelenchoides fujianensis]
MSIPAIFFFLLLVVGSRAAEKKPAGEWHEVEVNEEVQNLTQRAIERLNANLTTTQFKLLQIYDAKVQVVGGKRFLVNFQVAELNCSKNTECDDQLPVRSVQDKTVRVFVKPWAKLETFEFGGPELSEQTTNEKERSNNKNARLEVCVPLVLFMATILMK